METWPIVYYVSKLRKFHFTVTEKDDDVIF